MMPTPDPLPPAEPGLSVPTPSAPAAASLPSSGTPPVLPPQPVLEYQRLERARKVAIGGLRLLGTVMALLGLLPLIPAAVLILHGEPLDSAVPVILLGSGVVSLGVLKVACSFLIARRVRAAVWIALITVAVETLGPLFLLVESFIFAFTDQYESLAMHSLLPVLMCLVLTGWLAVVFEIVQVLRLERQPEILPP